jgi:hypothetical protein
MSEPIKAFILDRDKMSLELIVRVTKFLRHLKKEGVLTSVDYIPISEFTMKEPKTPKGKKSDVARDATMNKLGAIYNRKEGTKWSVLEVKAYKALGDIEKGDIELVGRYYAEMRKKTDDENWSKRDLLTLLNNWAGECDRARNYKFPPLKQVAYKQDTAPAGWIEHMEKKLGHRDFDTDWPGLSPCTRAEILTEMNEQRG